jgi:hypothetical protein
MLRRVSVYYEKHFFPCFMKYRLSIQIHTKVSVGHLLVLVVRHLLP